MPAKVGRPTKAPKHGARRVSLGLRVTPDVKRQLDAAADKNGRSQSQEAEFRLERSFEIGVLLDYMNRPGGKLTLPPKPKAKKAKRRRGR